MIQIPLGIRQFISLEPGAVVCLWYGCIQTKQNLQLLATFSVYVASLVNPQTGSTMVVEGMSLLGQDVLRNDRARR